nr:hypothetical peptide [Caraway yellows virus]
MQVSLSRAERHELIRKDLLSKGMPLEGVEKFLSLLRGVSEFREATPEQQKEILQKEDLTSGEPDLKVIYAERYDKVMAGIIGAAIQAASRPSGPNKFLFQRRVGRAIWAVTASVLKYAKLVGIAVAQRTQWDFVPIVKGGFIPSTEVCRPLSKNLGIQFSVAGEHDTQVPLGAQSNLEIQFPVAGEQDTQVPLGAQEIPGVQFQVAEELDTSVPNVDWGPAEAYLPFEINFSKANLCGPCVRAVGVPSFYGRFDIGDGLIPPPTSWQDILALSNLCISLEEADIEEFDAWLENKRAIESERLVVQPQVAAELDTVEFLDSNLNLVVQPQVAVELNTMESMDSKLNPVVQPQVAAELNTVESMDSKLNPVVQPQVAAELNTVESLDSKLNPVVQSQVAAELDTVESPDSKLNPVVQPQVAAELSTVESLDSKLNPVVLIDLPQGSGWNCYRAINTNSKFPFSLRGEENYFEFYSDPWPITTKEFTDLFISLDALSEGKDEWECVEKPTWPKHPFSFNINLLSKKRKGDNSVLQKPKSIGIEAFEALSYALNSLKKEEEPLTGKWHCYKEIKATKPTPRYKRGNENYILPPKVYERDCDQHREIECRYCFPRCPIEMHQMLRAKWNPILLASDCWLCPIEALVDVAEMEQDERDDQRFRLQCLQKHIDKLPDLPGSVVARKLETATPFKESFGGLFKAVSSHIPSPYRLGGVAAFIAAPALAYCH